MKSYVLLSAFLCNGLALGSAEVTPKELVGATYITKTKGGKTYKAGDEMMLSNRKQAREYHAMRDRIIAALRGEVLALKRQIAHAHVKRPISSKSRRSKYRNIVTLHGGIGPSGLKDTIVQGGTIIEPNKAIVGGITYSRRVYNRFRIGATFISSQNIKSATALGGVGYEF